MQSILGPDRGDCGPLRWSSTSPVVPKLRAVREVERQCQPFLAPGVRDRFARPKGPFAGTCVTSLPHTASRVTHVAKAPARPRVCDRDGPGGFGFDQTD